MVLILNDGISDPKTTHMLRCLRKKNEKYNSLSRIDNVIVTYKNELSKESNENAESNVNVPKSGDYIKQFPRKNKKDKG